jgi:hypothetical protein
LNKKEEDLFESQFDTSLLIKKDSQTSHHHIEPKMSLMTKESKLENTNLLNEDLETPINSDKKQECKVIKNNTSNFNDQKTVKKEIQIKKIIELHTTNIIGNY